MTNALFNGVFLTTPKDDNKSGMPADQQPHPALPSDELDDVAQSTILIKAPSQFEQAVQEILRKYNL